MTDSDSDAESPALSRPSLAQKEFDNSILQAGRALLDMARMNPVVTTEGPLAPTVAMRLTRLDPDCDEDPRIRQTVESLRQIGVLVELGERNDVALSVAGVANIPIDVTEPLSLLPTRHLNLDLSLLIALVSDLTHAPLPDSSDAAATRFVPSATYVEWKRERLRVKRAAEADGDDPSPEDNGPCQTFARTRRASAAGDAAQLAP
jgi:hypothetical protein